MLSLKNSSLIATVGREWKRITGRPIYLFSSVFVMLFCYVFFLTFFNQGLPNSLPAGVVDLDNSYVTRTFTRNIDATAQTEIVRHYSSYTEARQDMQRGNIYGFIVFGKDFEKKLLSSRRPELTYYVNDAYLIPGSLLLKDFTYMSALGSGYIQQRLLQARGMSDYQIMSTIQPVVLDSHLIANPWANYGIYLMNVLLPGVLQLMVLMLTIFSIGAELKERTSRNWLRTANNSMITALCGKLLPYTFIFTLLGIGGNFILYSYMHFPMNGSLAWMCLATFLYVIAHQAIGIFFIGVFPVMRDGISLAALYGLLGFTYAGFTFPIEGMPYTARIFSNIFPIRHYFNIYVNQALNGSDIRYSLIYFGALLAFSILPVFVYYRLKKAAIKLNYPAK
ncbi:MAG: ABC transporter permease [Bacteroidota bacterium]